eukprot:7251517-Prymnesium_polylepis.1
MVTYMRVHGVARRGHTIEAIDGACSIYAWLCHHLFGLAVLKRVTQPPCLVRGSSTSFGKFMNLPKPTRLGSLIAGFRTGSG